MQGALYCTLPLQPSSSIQRSFPYWHMGGQGVPRTEQSCQISFNLLKNLKNFDRSGPSKIKVITFLIFNFFCFNIFMKSVRKSDLNNSKYLSKSCSSTRRGNLSPWGCVTCQSKHHIFRSNSRFIRHPLRFIQKVQSQTGL